MADKNAKAIIDLEEFDLPGMKTHQEKLQENHTKLEKMQTTIQEQINAFKDGMISKADVTERLHKINDDLTKIADQVKVASNANSVETNRYVYNDFRSMLEGVNWLYKESGQPYTDIDYRAHALFQMSVDYEKFDRGQELRNLRNLHDTVYILDRVHNFQAMSGGIRYRIESMPLFRALIKHTEPFDPILARAMAGGDIKHAMAGGNVGFGAEWLPVEMSNEFNEVLRIIPSLANRFKTWMMPKGASAKFPFQGGKAKAYKGGEALVDNPDRARKTNIGTAVKTFTPVLFIASLSSSEEVTEDSIISMLDFIRRELAMAILEGLESAIINGDTDASHQDNNETDHYATYDLETAFIGLRAMAFDSGDTFDQETYSSTSGIGSLQVDAFLHAQQVMNLAAVNPGEMFWLTGPKGRIECMKALQKEDALGILQFIISGKLPTFYGAEIHISGQYNESLEADGLGGDDADHTSIIGVHPDSYRIGQRRGVTLEATKDIETQQIKIVSTARFDFGRVSLSTEKPVVNIIHIEHT